MLFAYPFPIPHSDFHILRPLAIIIFVKKIKILKPERSPSWYTQITQPEIFVDKIEMKKNGEVFILGMKSRTKTLPLRFFYTIVSNRP